MNLQVRLPKCALESPLNNYGESYDKTTTGLDWNGMDWTSKTWISKICVRNPMNYFKGFEYI